MKRVLVTGAAGFVGRHALPRLVEDGFEVHAVTSRRLPVDPGRSTWHRADLLDADQRAAVLDAAAPDAVLHLAWCAKPPSYWTDPANLRWLTASLELARAFGDAGGKRFVGAGTCAEYDWSAGHCVERATPLAPSSLYGAAKAACGTVLEKYGEQSGLSFAWGRLFFLFGSGDARSRLLPSIVAAIEDGRPARCLAGEHVRDFISVEDAASALVALLRSSATGPVNIASGVPMKVGDFARAVAETLGRPDLLVVEPGPEKDAVLTADTRRLNEEVGWRQQAGTSTRIEDAVRWWRTCPSADPQPKTGDMDCA